MRHSSFGPASSIFEYGVHKYPQSDALRRDLGIASFGANNFKKAGRVFGSLLNEHPDDAALADLLGRTCDALASERSGFCTGLPAFAKAHPANASASLYAAIALLHQPGSTQTYAEADSFLQAALKAEPKLAAAWYQQGVLQQLRNDWASSTHPANPTLFEDMRRDLNRPAEDIWVVAPSNGFGGVGESSHSSFGPGLGARVLLPKHLLAAAVAARKGDAAAPLNHLLRDNYETPVSDPSPTGSLSSEQLARTANLLGLSLQDFERHALSLQSPDELSVFIARQLMREIAPSLLWLTLHDIDIAHSGAFSLYLDGIQRSDRLCAEVWRTIRNRTAIRSHHDEGTTDGSPHLFESGSCRHSDFRPWIESSRQARRDGPRTPDSAHRSRLALQREQRSRRT